MSKRINRFLYLAISILLILSAAAEPRLYADLNQNRLIAIQVLKYALALPLSIAVVAATFRSFYWMYHQYIVGTVAFVNGVVLVAISGLGGDPGHGPHIIYWILINIFMGLRYYIALGITCFLFVAFNAGNAYTRIAGENNRREWQFSLYYTAASTILLACISYLIERSLRQSVLQQALLKHEQKRLNVVLYNLLPKECANQLLKGVEGSAVEYEAATILFADITNFKVISRQLNSGAMSVQYLNDVFSKMDKLLDEFNLYKVETIGEVYMVAGGLPDVCSKKMHMSEAAYFALTLRQFANEYKWRGEGKVDPLQMRIGINTGTAIAGVVGKLLPRYRLFGDTVNVASRMSTTSKPGQIQVTETFASELKSRFDFKSLGLVKVKGKGMMQTYDIVGVAEKRRVSQTRQSVAPKQLPSILDLISSSEDIPYPWATRSSVYERKVRGSPPTTIRRRESAVNLFALRARSQSPGDNFHSRNRGVSDTGLPRQGRSPKKRHQPLPRTLKSSQNFETIKDKEKKAIRSMLRASDRSNTAPSIPQAQNSWHSQTNLATSRV
ncbi:hypothetical protein AAMO2058_001608100 [Amorphochlora amoebiformis]